MSENDGIIKFNCTHIKSEPPPTNELQAVMTVREDLYNSGLIGVDKQGIAYGNISIRIPGSHQFYITGSQSGVKRNISNYDFSHVIKYDISENSLVCKGSSIASSESLTHAAAYDSNSTISTVVHIHNLDIWTRLKGIYATTSKDSAYGSVELALEIGKICRLASDNIIILEGHKDGIIITGNNIIDSYARTMNLKNYKML